MIFALSLSVVLVAYNTIFNLRLPLERLYVPANVAATAALVAVARVRGLTFAEVGLTDPVHGFGRGLVWGLAIAASVLVTIFAVVRLAGSTRFMQRFLSDRRADLRSGELAYQTLVRIPFGTALFEEVAFRGLLLAAFAVPLSRPGAVLASSAVFGLWHVAPTIEALYLNRVERSTRVLWGVLAAVVLTTVGGVGFCVLRYLTGGIVAPALAHWAMNSGGILAAYLAQQRDPGSGADLA